MGSWIDREVAGCAFADARLGKRFGKLMEQLSQGIGRTIPLACGDWAATKAAYRFLDNDRVSEADILAGHFAATRERFDAVDGPVLVLHDTTEFSFTREDAEAIGITHKVAKGQHKDEKGRPRQHTVCGILMHSSLVVTTEGLPLGLAAIKLWTRRHFKGTNALKGKGIDGGKHSYPDRGEGERPLAGERPAVNRNAGRPEPRRPRRRPRGRHLRAVLRVRVAGVEVPLPHLREPPGR
jgi:hypothetical protein